jgi:hypothetical protein
MSRSSLVLPMVDESFARCFVISTAAAASAQTRAKFKEFGPTF